MEKYLCIHGHFYQPPRENAWLEEIELQESAQPFHDWNERITYECYAPNATSRILSHDGKIIDIVNNYAKISFNFGPTLLSWLEKYASPTYQHIVEGDKISQSTFGHGSAMAQVYNHIIMPLANRRDKETQVKWGIIDFKSRFNRKPEGMWLAETAVDTETLEVLAENDIKFTVLAPRQAKRFRKLGSEHWYNGINPKKHYLCRLPSGKTITLFFYDGAASQAVAFKGLLNDGKKFAHSLLEAFDEGDENPQLVHIATDGESYGHHHKHGDMALAYCLRYIEENNLATITNYSQYMHRFPAEHEVEIHENTSWSCIHGVERWRSDCGCSTGGYPNWNQAWRKPLRESLDWLRDVLNDTYEERMAKITDKDAWEIRDEYINVILNRKLKNVESFIEKNTNKTIEELGHENKIKFMRLLEMQRHVLLMFTSCAWFFDEISGIETVQILQYANRAIQLYETTANDTYIEKDFLQKIQDAISNIPEYHHGAYIYKEFTSPARLTLSKVGMHYAIASLFTEDPDSITVLNYYYTNHDFRRYSAGIQKLAIGRTTVHSNITLSEKDFSFAVLYLGQHQIIGSSSSTITQEEFDEMKVKIEKAFNFGNISDTLQIMRQYFKAKNFSIWELFKDEQIKVLNTILKDNLEQAEEFYETIYNRNYNILNIMRNANLTTPNRLKQNMDMVINNQIEDFFEQHSKDVEKLKHLCTEVEKWNVILDDNKIALLAADTLHDMMLEFYRNTSKIDVLEKIHGILSLLERIKISPNYNRLQTFTFHMAKRFMPVWHKAQEDEKVHTIMTVFLEICEKLNIKVNLENLVGNKDVGSILDLFN